MKLVLVDDAGEMLDYVHCQWDEFQYAQEDGGAATLLLGNLLPMRYRDAGDTSQPLYVYIAKGFSRQPGIQVWDDDTQLPERR